MTASDPVVYRNEVKVDGVAGVMDDELLCYFHAQVSMIDRLNRISRHHNFVRCWPIATTPQLRTKPPTNQHQPFNLK